MYRRLLKSLKTFIRFWPIGLLLAILVACQSPSVSRGPVVIDGSSTVYPITEAVAQAFTETHGKEDKISVEFSGTSGGFRKFCQNQTQINNASRPILIAEMNSCIQNTVPFIEIPVGFDALTVAVSKENTWAKDITVEELKQIWSKAAQGKITRWNQIRPTYPDQPLLLYGAGSDSGTFDYFNEAILGDPKGAREDYTGSEDDEVIAAGIAQSPNALGYLPFAYYEAHQDKLRALAIDSGKGPVLPSTETVQNATYQPLSRPLFIYVNAKDAQDNSALRDFVEFYLEQGATKVAQVGYIPLPEEGYQLAKIQFGIGEVGTAFRGVPEPDITITEVLRRKAQFPTNNN